MAIELTGVYDGTAVYLLHDGTLVNRFAGDDGWGETRSRRAQEWIDEHGPAFRERWFAGREDTR